MKKLLTILMALALTFSACTVFALTDGSAESAVDVSAYFSERDLSGAWKESSASVIALSGQSEFQITAAGVYVLSGAMQGSVTVNAGSQDKVQLVLNGVDITAANTAAISVENADKVFITLAEGTRNTLTVSSFDGDSDLDAAIFSRDDLTLNGSGALTIVSAANGIVCKDDLRIAGGSYDITAEGRGIDANDSVRVYDGSFVIVSGKDAIRAKHDESEKGYVLIMNGSFNLTVNGGAANGETHTDDMMRGFARGGWEQNAASEDGTPSAKGVKASGSITVLDGTFVIDASDDAFHADGDLTVEDGSIRAQSGDDGMHADNALTINGGALIISGYEGLEASAIAINGGDIAITASDDGLNAAGGSDSSGFWRNDMFASDGSSIVINGGSLYVNADGDGIDSNGDLTVNGGVVVVSGPTNSGNGALDYNGTGSVNGGIVIAAGAYGMAETFGDTSTQVSFLTMLNGSGGTIAVTDASGSTLLSGTVEKGYQCVVISSPALQVGETYTVSSDSDSAQVSVTAVSSGSTGGFGMGGEMPGGWNNQQGPGGQQMPGGQRHGGGRRW